MRMRRNWLTALAALFAMLWPLAVSAEAPPQRLPSAVLIWPLIVVEGGGAVTDTRIELVNLNSRPVSLGCLFVTSTNCNSIDFQIRLTPNQPLSWLASGGVFNGQSAVPPFNQPGRAEVHRSSGRGLGRRAQCDPGPRCGLRCRRADHRLQRGRLSAPDRRSAHHPDQPRRGHVHAVPRPAAFRLRRHDRYVGSGDGERAGHRPVLGRPGELRYAADRYSVPDLQRVRGAVLRLDDRDLFVAAPARSDRQRLHP